MTAERDRVAIDQLNDAMERMDHAVVAMEQKVAEIETNPPPPPQIYTLLNKVMNDVGAVGKDSKNQQQGWNFRGIDACLSHLSPAFVKHGVVPSICCDDHVVDYVTVTNKDGYQQNLARARLRLTLALSAPDASSVKHTAVGEAWDYNGDKATNKAMSVAFKYAVFLGLCIPVEGLDDSDNDEKQETYVAGGPAPRAKGPVETAGQRSNYTPRQGRPPQGKPQYQGGGRSGKRGLKKEYDGGRGEWGPEAKDPQIRKAHACANENTSSKNEGHQLLQFMRWFYCDDLGLRQPSTFEGVKVGELRCIIDIFEGEHRTGITADEALGEFAEYMSTIGPWEPANPY